MAKINLNDLVFYTTTNGEPFPELTGTTPADVKIDLELGKWQYLPEDEDEDEDEDGSIYGSWFDIGDTKNPRASAAGLSPQDSRGTILVFDRTQLSHLQHFEALAFQIGAHS